MKKKIQCKICWNSQRNTIELCIRRMESQIRKEWNYAYELSKGNENLIKQYSSPSGKQTKIGEYI